MNSVSLDVLAKKVQSIKDRFERLEKDVKGLKDLLNVHDNWHSTIRKWVGNDVRVCDRQGITTGILLWSDRYNVCVRPYETVKEWDHKAGQRTRMYTKGGINWIEEA
jgi:hypothetical protein